MKEYIMWSIKTAENEIVDIVADRESADDYISFLNEVADIDDSSHYLLSETTEADVAELALQEG
jgi:hypothetical protein|tara:strand:+ start:248 stop:439 length:192 start_codon:yes stop_codon:yes gene_type:complete